jgi:hypothetical protein
MGNYCLVEESVITYGPGSLPRSWRNISGLSLLDGDDAALKDLGWLPFVDVKPSYDKDTQYITGSRVISATAVTMNNTVNDYSAEHMTEKVEQLQLRKLAELYDNVKQFISYQSNGWPRYDVDLKLNMMNAAMAAMAAGGSEPVKVKQAKDWIMAVQQAFFGIKTAIIAAATLAELRNIDASYEWFESQYGREGVVEADPAISTDDLFE